MIEVHVRDQHRVDGREVRGVEAGLDETLRQLADAAREDRVGEDHLVVDLDERGGVPDPEDGEARVLVDGLLQLLDLARRHEERAHGLAAGARDEAAGEHAAGGGDQREREDGSGDGACAHQKYLMRKVPMAVSGPLSGAIVACTPKMP